MNHEILLLCCTTTKIKGSSRLKCQAILVIMWELIMIEYWNNYKSVHWKKTCPHLMESPQGNLSGMTLLERWPCPERPFFPTEKTQELMQIQPVWKDHLTWKTTFLDISGGHYLHIPLSTCYSTFNFYQPKIILPLPILRIKYPLLILNIHV